MTGESVGQVASQTLQNIAVINAAVTLPVLRPLVGSDKEEISREARAIGTYQISIIPDQDCCQLFTPRNPATKARLSDVAAAEAELPITEMVESAVAEAEREDFSYPATRSEANARPECWAPNPRSLLVWDARAAGLVRPAPGRPRCNAALPPQTASAFLALLSRISVLSRRVNLPRATGGIWCRSVNLLSTRDFRKTR